MRFPPFSRANPPAREEGGTPPVPIFVKYVIQKGL